MKQLPYLHGKPVATGDLRTSPADFKVFELLPFQPSGEGEHVILHVRKTGLNTVFVARQLAKCFGVKDNHVTYAGLKDKYAVCEQYFSVHLPGKAEILASSINIDGVEVLSICRHNKKLKTGALLGNRFELTLRNVSHIDTLEQRWQRIISHGVPNYFGEQRFGIEQGNLARAESLFAGQKVKDKKKRGMYLSAARSFIFNEITGDRVKKQTFSEIELGDVCMLSGSQSVFLVDAIDETLANRLAEFDIDLTAPMWGKGELMSQADIAKNEQAIADKHAAFSKGLAEFGLKQERRKMRLTMQLPKLAILENTVTVSFALPAGSYATTILRELIQYQDINELQRREKNKEAN